MSIKSSVCAIMKNESQYICEWVAHYINLGFDEVIVYENDSDDDTAEILKRLSAAGIIKYVSWPSENRKSPQVSSYEDALSYSDSDWILFVDTDEFLVFNEDISVNEFLSRFDDEVASVSVNWRIFGSSGKEANERDYVIRRFTKASAPNFIVNHHVKTFVRPGSVKRVHIHACEVSGRTVNANGDDLCFPKTLGIADKIKFDVASINHYFTKSKEEFSTKKGRGNANRAAKDHDKFLRYTAQLFIDHDQNQVDDTSALKYLKKNHDLIASMGSWALFDASIKSV